jgi:hypothetical protein
VFALRFFLEFIVLQEYTDKKIAMYEGGEEERRNEGRKKL